MLANIKSQIKRDKQSEKARLRNRGAKSEIKTYIGKFETAAAAGDKEAAAPALARSIKLLDKAAMNNVIHANTAANKKSSLMKRFNSLE